MAQVTIYLPDHVAEDVRQRAMQANKSLSAFVSELISQHTGAERWPLGLLDVLREGSGDLREPPDPPPEDIEPLT